MGGFYITVTLDWKKLILPSTLSIYFLFFHEETLFPQLSKLTRHTFHKSIKHRMQTGNLANNSHKQFYVLLNTNEIKLYIYPNLLKENPFLKKFLNSESTAYFLDETFYHTNMLL